jgi:hypothetical protein
VVIAALALTTLLGGAALIACGPPPIGWQGAGRLQTLPAPQSEAGPTAPVGDTGADDTGEDDADDTGADDTSTDDTGADAGDDSSDSGNPLDADEAGSTPDGQAEGG